MLKRFKLTAIFVLRMLQTVLLYLLEYTRWQRTASSLGRRSLQYNHN